MKPQILSLTLAVTALAQGNLPLNECALWPNTYYVNTNSSGLNPTVGNPFLPWAELWSYDGTNYHGAATNQTPGQTIHVSGNATVAGNFYMTNGSTLEGDSINTTLYGATNIHSGFVIMSDNCTLQNITLDQGKNSGAPLKIYSATNFTVRNVRIHNYNDGFYTVGGARGQYLATGARGKFYDVIIDGAGDCISIAPSNSFINFFNTFAVTTNCPACPADYGSAANFSGFATEIVHGGYFGVFGYTNKNNSVLRGGHLGASANILIGPVIDSGDLTTTPSDLKTFDPDIRVMQNASLTNWQGFFFHMSSNSPVVVSDRGGHSGVAGVTNVLYFLPWSKGFVSLSPWYYLNSTIAGTNPVTRGHYELNSDGTLNVSSNVTAGSFTLAGSTITRWPSGTGRGGAYCSPAGVWTSASDRNEMQGFTPVAPREILARLVALPITQWKYKIESAGVKHIGPVAQDFHAAFGAGDNDRAIGAVDEGGVALAAIQGLNEVIQEKDARIKSLEKDVAQLKSLVTALVQKPKGGGQ